MIIDSFTAQYGFLSNFYPVVIAHEDKSYPSVEHLYQAMKTLNEDMRKDFQTTALVQMSPGQAKRAGRRVKLRKDWKTVKVYVMTYAIKEKFKHLSLKQKLLATADAELIEGNYWHDNFWGACRCEKCKDKKKLNMLGKLLMEHRANLERKQ